MPAWPYEPRQPLVRGLDPPDPREPAAEPDDDGEFWELDDGMGDVPSLAEQIDRRRR